MWSISWDSTNEAKIDYQNEVIELIERINEEYKQTEPVIVQIESMSHKLFCIGVGCIEELSCLDFFPTPDGLGSMHPISKGEEKSDRSIVFWLDSYDSEWEVDSLIPYKDAISELSYFLKHDDVSTNYIWELD